MCILNSHISTLFSSFLWLCRRAKIIKKKDLPPASSSAFTDYLQLTLTPPEDAPSHVYKLVPGANNPNNPVNSAAGADWSNPSAPGATAAANAAATASNATGAGAGAPGAAAATAVGVDAGYPRLYVAIKQPFFDLTPAAALTPLYKPVPFVLRKAHVFMQVSTSPTVKGLTNHGVRDQLAAAYLVFRTYFKTTPRLNDFKDYPGRSKPALGGAGGRFRVLGGGGTGSRPGSRPSSRLSFDQGGRGRTDSRVDFHDSYIHTNDADNNNHTGNNNSNVSLNAMSEYAANRKRHGKDFNPTPLPQSKRLPHDDDHHDDEDDDDDEDDGDVVTGGKTEASDALKRAPGKRGVTVGATPGTKRRTLNAAAAKKHTSTHTTGAAGTGMSSNATQPSKGGFQANYGEAAPATGPGPARGSLLAPPAPSSRGASAAGVSADNEFSDSTALGLMGFDNATHPDSMSPNSNGNNNNNNNNGNGIDSDTDPLPKLGTGGRVITATPTGTAGDDEDEDQELYQEVTVFATTVKHQNGVLTWTFSGMFSDIFHQQSFIMSCFLSTVSIISQSNIFFYFYFFSLLFSLLHYI